VDLLSRRHENGRRFQVSEAVERGAAVALGLTILQPDWSGTVNVFKVFTFGAASDKVLQMQDCESREATMAVLPAG
jgi:hypothetical protein